MTLLLLLWRASALTLSASLAVALAGCGQLRVAVDVLDPEYVRDQLVDEGMRKLYRQVIAAQSGDFAAANDRRFKNYQREVEQLAKCFVNQAKSFAPATAEVAAVIADGWRQAVASGSIPAQAQRQGTELERQAQAIRELSATGVWSGRGPVPLDVAEHLRAFQVEEKRLQVVQTRDAREIRSSLLKQVAGSPAATLATAADCGSAPTAAAVAAQATVVIQAAQRSIIQGSEIATTEYAYAVASAPESLWKTNYNQAFGSGSFGNVDVVIRMNSTADFSVKGMRFDASTVAQVASKVMTQALLIGAQMAGVPVATASTGTTSGGDAVSKSSADLAALDSALARRDALNAAQRDAIRAAARTLLSAAPQLESGALKDKPKGDTTRDALHQSVADTVNALRPLLAMQDLQ